MKKIITSILFAFLAGSIMFAQELSAAKETGALASVVDSLSSQLNKLQHDYDFLFCDFKLTQEVEKLNTLNHSISLSTDRIMMDLYHNAYNYEMATLRTKELESLKSNYDSQKQSIQSTKTLVMLKMVTLDFTKEELDVLHSYFNSIDATCNSIEAGLRLHEAALTEYKRLR